jgi:aspartate oxidase
MTADAGVLRSAASLAGAQVAIDRTAALAGTDHADHPEDVVAACELANLALVGRALCAAARAREETRGAHARSDFPEASPAFRVRFVTRG